MTRLLPIAALAWLTAAGVLAEEPDAKEAKAPPPAAGAVRPKGSTGAGPGHRLNNPLNPGQRFLQMTPEEQERLMELANPRQQERMREALERYNSLPPQARARLFRQYQLLKNLPPGQQALISRQFQAFNQLPEGRRLPVGQELIRLHGMPPEQRNLRLASEDFIARYSPGEQEILRDLSLNLPPEYPLAGR